MKTIVCGPPHSGKSVFISNLVRLMPSEAFQRINANGDGEDTWSNNPNQAEVQSVRIKGTNTEKDFLFWRGLIESAVQQIVLVDIGGKLQEDKAPLFDVCDSFIVVSNSEDMIREWMKFGESHGCKCIATILSVLGHCEEEILSLFPLVQGKMSGLERGRNIQGSKILSAVAESIVTNAGYNGFQTKSVTAHTIDFFDIGKKLGCYKSWFTRKGIEVSNIWYEFDKAELLHDYLINHYNITNHYRIYGAKSIWVSCIAVSCLGNETGTNIEFYDEWTNSFISPVILNQYSEPQNVGLEINSQETDKAIWLSFNVTNNMIDAARLIKYQLPELNREKALFISGGIPNWFIASVLLSYKNATKFVLVPGHGYVKVECPNSNELGSVHSTYTCPSHTNSHDL